MSCLKLGALSGSRSTFNEAMKRLFKHPNQPLFSQLSDWQKNLDVGDSKEDDQMQLIQKEETFVGPCAVFLALLSSNQPLTPIHYSATANDAHLLGKNELDRALVLQWISYAYDTISPAIHSNSQLPAICSKLESALAHSNFLVSSYFSLADYFVLESLKPHLKTLIGKKNCEFNSVIRWSLFVNHIVDLEDTLSKGIEQLKIQDLKPAINATNPAVTAKKSKANAVPAKVERVDSRPLFCRVDVRVGHIVSVQQHPNADSLYMEEVDFGEGRKRTILSGLAKCLPMDALEGKLAVFVVNLKPATLRGIKSEGMILAATSQEGTVELVLPPPGCKPGDKVIVDGIEPELFTADEVLDPKKKVMDQVQETLLVDSEGFATWDSKPLIVLQKGPLTLPTVRNCPIK